MAALLYHAYVDVGTTEIHEQELFIFKYIIWKDDVLKLI